MKAEQDRIKGHNDLKKNIGAYSEKKEAAERAQLTKEEHSFSHQLKKGATHFIFGSNVMSKTEQDEQSKRFKLQDSQKGKGKYNLRD